MGKLSTWILLGLALLAVSMHGVQVRAEVPSETECRPYIEKALHELKAVDDDGVDSSEAGALDTGSASAETDDDDDGPDKQNDVDGNIQDENNDSGEDVAVVVEDDNDDSAEDATVVNDDNDDNNKENDQDDSSEADAEVVVEADDDVSKEEINEAIEVEDVNDDDEKDDDNKSEEDQVEDNVNSEEKAQNDEEIDVSVEDTTDDQTDNDVNDSNEQETDETKSTDDSNETDGDDDKNDDDEDDDNNVTDDDDSTDSPVDANADESAESEDQEEDKSSKEEADENDAESNENTSAEDIDNTADSKEGDEDSKEGNDVDDTENSAEESKEDQIVESSEDLSENAAKTDVDSGEDSKEENISKVTAPVALAMESFPEDDLLIEYEVPTNLRDTSHIAELLHLDNDSEESEKAVDKVSDVILKDLKKIYEGAIKPLETLYKYRDLSNRHFSDPEIFSKPLVLFMGPWSGGKSTILNYLTDNEHTADSLRTGAEPSPAYFNILMHGDEPEVLDGTQLAADWTFSGLQKFGQGLEDRLRGQKLPHKLLEKVNIVEIPGILEVRKHVSRLFPFNDACQWFIDRADIIFLVYDPSKLDVGPETEAILDQLKGREYQTKIILNKADQVKPEELLRVQGALIWNISPLMSSAQPPVMYTTSLWSHPYEVGAPVRLLQAQERGFLRDLRNAIDKRIDNKIASARRFAVRVRNHAKMVDCYLTTYYNHKTLFGNKKQISNEIIEHPQNYHIYEGLSTLTNISRYDLPDPEVYRDFFRLNPLYEFKKLSETCTYFRGCPINKLDIAIAYDLPELVGKYKKLMETALVKLDADKTKSKS